LAGGGSYTVQSETVTLSTNATPGYRYLVFRRQQVRLSARDRHHEQLLCGAHRHHGVGPGDDLGQRSGFATSALRFPSPGRLPNFGGDDGWVVLVRCGVYFQCPGLRFQHGHLSDPVLRGFSRPAIFGRPIQRGEPEYHAARHGRRRSLPAGSWADAYNGWATRTGSTTSGRYPSRSWRPSWTFPTLR